MPLLTITLGLLELLRPGWLVGAGLGVPVWATMVLTLGRAAARAAARLVPGGGAGLHLATGAFLFLVAASSLCTSTGLLAATRLSWVLLATGAAAWASGLGAASSEPPFARDAAQQRPGERTLSRSFLFLAAAGIGIVGLASLRRALQDADAMWYHLPLVAEWLRSASIAPSAVVPELARAYPGLRAGAQVYLALPLGHEHLASLGVFELALLWLAVTALLAEHGVPSSLSRAAAAVVVLTPIATRAALSEGTDLLLASACVLYVLFARRALARGRPADAGLAGLALGSVAAAKYSGLPIALALAAIAVVEAFGRRAASGRTAGPRSLAWLLAGAFLVAGPWYLRNLVVFGNPLWPARIAPAGVLLFDGPLASEWLAERTLGFDLAPLVEHSRHFVQAFGWAALPAGLGLVALPVLAWARRAAPAARDARAGVAAAGGGWLLAAAPAALFLLFLQQPFNQPSVHYAYNMRYLLPCFALGLAATTVGLGLRLGGRARVVAALAYGALAVSGLALWTRWWALATAASLLAAALAGGPWRSMTRFARWADGWGVAGRVALLLGLILVAWPLERLTRAVQYDPQAGYHDSPSALGWGSCVRFVHRELEGQRIAFHGHGLFFPLYGDRLSNEVFALPAECTPRQALDWCRERSIDVLVTFVPSHRPPGSAEYVFGQSLGAGVLAADARVEVLHEDRGAYVLRLPDSR